MVPLIWFAAGIGCVLAELATATFVLLMFAAGAFAAGVVSVVGFSLTWQVLIFTVVSVLALALVRPLLRKHVHRSGQSHPMGTAAIEGTEALVLEMVDDSNGQVKIDGEIWTARAYQPDQVIPPGARVRVVEVRGATAMVWRD